MYKIMTKLHTTAENIYAFYMVENDEGETVEYTVSTPEEAAEQGLEVLKEVGYADLRIVDDQSYYLDLIYGTKPVPEPDTYTLEVFGPDYMTAEPQKIENIAENTTVQVTITFDEPVTSYHLIIDDKEYKSGLPAWVTEEEITSSERILTFSGITRDHVVEVEVDETNDDDILSI